jgi:putative ABC transport system permease protein
MHLSESIKISLLNIFSHKFRSFLTLLGIIIGVFAVVTMFSSVYGIKKLVSDRMEGLGWNNSIIIYPSSGNENTSTLGRRFYYIARENKPLTLNDYLMIKREVDARYIYGMIESWEKHYQGEKDSWVRLKATNKDFFYSQTYPLKSGRYFNTFEMTNAFKVCILGYHFANNNFTSDPLDQFVKIGNNRYKVIGVLDDDVLNTNGMNFNPWGRRHDLSSVYIPLSTGAEYLKSSKAIDYIYLQAEDEEKFTGMKTETRQKLLAQHKMAHDFSFNDVGAIMLQITQEMDSMMKKWNITLFAIASISLIVGGIGLFSTLLISINERMMEIGIRKSIGATDKDIFLLFLLEAIILSLFAAFIGIAISTALIKVVVVALNFDFPVPVQGIMLGLGFSLLIGIISGLYPAVKASKIDPISAIYYFE